MAVRTCRVCGRDFFREPLLRYQNMPKAAQKFPDEAALTGETGVDLEVCQCTGCGLVQLSNDPVPYYREVIRATAVSDADQGAQRQNSSPASSRTTPCAERRSSKSDAAEASS